MTDAARRREGELTRDEADRLLAELWAGYQELLADERTEPECTSQASE